jgi:hypothetical protein
LNSKILNYDEVGYYYEIIFSKSHRKSEDKVIIGEGKKFV